MSGLCKFRKTFAVIIIVCVSVLMFLYSAGTRIDEFGASLVDLYEPLNDTDIHTPCTIHPLDPWDVSLKPYIAEPSPIVCSDRFDLFYVQKDGRLALNKSVAKLHNIDIKKWRCFYQLIERLLGDVHLKFAEKVEFSSPVSIDSHLFRVTCQFNSLFIPSTVYDMAHFNPFYSNRSNERGNIHNETASTPSVIILGLDSMSRSHAIRNLPKSMKFLRDELQAYDFIGYRKVGLNTFPNLMPLLTGKSHGEFPEFSSNAAYADDMPLLWSEEYAKHMATFFAEDRSDITTFNLGKRGFFQVPTNFYIRPYLLAMQEFDPVFMSKLERPDSYCYGRRGFFDLMLEYLKGFLGHYTNKQTLAFFWENSLGHDKFNDLKLGDDLLLEFLQWMKSERNMDNTLLMVLSDHGFRIGGASLTHIGRAENSNPFLMVHVPRNLKEDKTIDQILTHNTKQLLTPYDIYQTVHDLLTPYDIYQTVHDFLSNKSSEERYVKTHLVRRSIFRPIPSTRTCADAGLDATHCTCTDRVPVSIDSKVVRLLAIRLVKELNKILEQDSNCAAVTLHNITEASVHYTLKNDLNVPEGLQNTFKLTKFRDNVRSAHDLDRTSGRYSVLFYTQPGSAYYEGLIDFTQFGSGDKMAVIGEPARLNKYGNQSHCVANSELRTFCFCVDLLKNGAI
ncbi:uncharacterized protein LOC127866464 [Dreissena polymorpha]|uniref:Uncharacterized protein n=1 Tax=Dreissena polymorpha TaxID=45954 RepID=A0A9D4LR60_DREPO|nr:uncharacterized protein LOC127866464 [Dreissena polymorpha]KAH3863198.1 hypothetical protein DPMN_026178 [Dreissena polymorpha]